MSSLSTLILPGYDSKNGNRNSFLYKAFGEMCNEYVLDKPLEEQESIIKPSSEIAVVHSYGFFIFLVGYQNGLFKNIKSLIVFDGWFPSDCKFNGIDYSIELPDIRTVFFFPTFGDRKDYPLESIVRQSMISRKNITVVRGLGFGHNLLFGEFDENSVNSLTVSLLRLPDERSNDLDLVVKFLGTKVET